MVRNSAPLDLVRYVFPTGFDPSVSGQLAPVGTIGMSADGLSSWLHTAVGATAWASDLKLARIASLEFLVANAFDPRVTGLAAPVGARSTTADGTASWVKWGTADRAWRGVTSGSLAIGVGLLTWSGLDVDVLGEYEITFSVTKVGPTANGAYLQINGSTPGAISFGVTGTAAVPVGWAYMAGHAANWNIGDAMTGVIRVFSPLGSAASQLVSWEAKTAGQKRRGSAGVAAGTSIASVGIMVQTAGETFDNSAWTIRGLGR
jgi:hypothetical protein